jgi:hypothetical protein
VAFTYQSPAAARADLAPREHVLAHGVSLISDLPYTQLLRVSGGQASGSSIVIDVAQPPHNRLALGDMFNRSDLGFARC